MACRIAAIKFYLFSFFPSILDVCCCTSRANYNAILLNYALYKLAWICKTTMHGNIRNALPSLGSSTKTLRPSILKLVSIPRVFLLCKIDRIAHSQWIISNGIFFINPFLNVLSYSTDNELYSGTVADFSGSDPIIYREPLQTEQYDSLSLNGKLIVSIFNSQLSYCSQN